MYIPGAATRILPNLWIGDVHNAQNQKRLNQLGITHLVSAAVEHPPPSFENIETEHIPLRDVPEEKVLPHLPALISFVTYAHLHSGNVMVYSNQGNSRAVALSMAYIMRTQNKTAFGALDVIRQLRPFAEPSAGFMAELSEFEVILRRRNGLMSSQQSAAQRISLTTHAITPDKAAIAFVRCCLSWDSQSSHVGRYVDAENRAVEALYRDSSKDATAIIKRVIIDSFRTYASTSKTDIVARNVLVSIFQRLVKRYPQAGAAVREAIDGLQYFDTWNEMVEDVPLGPEFLKDLSVVIETQWFQAQVAT